MTETESEFTDRILRDAFNAWKSRALVVGSDVMAMKAEIDRLRAQDEAIRAYFGGKRDGRDTIEILKEAFHAKWSEEDTLVEAMLDHKTADLKAENEKLTEELSIWKSVFPDIAPERVLPDRSKMEADNARLAAENEKMRAALSQIVEHCDNPGAWNEIVQERIIERCEETARAALAGSPPSEQPAPPSPWLPIETAPNDGSMIIQLLRNNTVIIGPSSQVDATHWMPIPPPPEAGE